MPGRLAGKVILITGAARGQGEAAARLCAREGASVVLGDILTELGAAVADEIGAEARFTKLDVTSESDWQRAVELAETEFGGLHGLLNNAGIFSPEALAETSPELWARVVATNQTGPYLGMRAAVPAIRRSGGGSIVNVSSIPYRRCRGGRGRRPCAARQARPSAAGRGRGRGCDTGPMSERGRFSTEQAREIGGRIGIDWSTSPFDVEQFRMGLEVELEHGRRDPATNVSDDDELTTGKIARAHLNEFPDYYTRLAKMETEAEEYWSTRKPG